MGIRRLPFKFGEFAPDAPDYDNPYTETLYNALPLYGGLRSVRRTAQRSEIQKQADNYITGAYGHLLSDDFDIQRAKAASNALPAGFCDHLGSTSVLNTAIAEYTPDDETFILSMSEEANLGTGGTDYWIKYDLTDVDDPTVNTGHVIALRYRGWFDTGTHTLSVELYQGTAQVGTAPVWTATNTGTTAFGGGTWLYKEATIGTAAIAGITDYTDLNIKINWDAAGMTADNDPIHQVPGEDTYNQDAWRGEGDEAIALYSHINDVASFGDSAVDTTYIATPLLEGTTTKKYRCKLPMGDRPMNLWYSFPSGSLPGLEYNVRAKVSNKDTTKLTVKFKNRTTGEFVVPSLGTNPSIEDFVFAADDTWETINCSLQFGAHYFIDMKDLEMEFSFAHTGGSGVDQAEVPDADISVGNWEDEGGATTNLFQSINDDSDSTYIQIPQTLAAESYKCRIPAMDDPESYQDGDVSITIRAKSMSGASSPRFIAKLYYDGGSFQKEFACENTITDHVWSLTEAQARALDWGNTWTLEIIKKRTTSTRSIAIYEVDVAASGSAGQGFIGDVWVELAGLQGLEVSWLELRLPQATDQQLGDQQQIYAGSTEKLYRVDDNFWTDVGRTADYGQTNRVPQCWDFCSWGGNVIASNYEDEIQYLDLENGSTAFVQLCQGTTDEEYEVRGKFVDVVKNHLVVCNIGACEDFDVPTAFTDAYSYSVWWSHINNPRKFGVGDYTNLSDLDHLRQTRGEITGFIGGEYGTIFKRDSIYRMSWVGGNLVFRFDVLARGVGTSHPKSIVAIDQDIYFYGHNDFYVMPQGGKPQPLGMGKIQSFLTEYLYESRAINRSEVDEQWKHDMRVSGAYDQFSGLIFWSVDNNITSSSFAMKTDIIVFNPMSRTWGYIRDVDLDDPNFGVGVLVTAPNIPNDELYTLNNLYLACNDTSLATNQYQLRKFTSGNTNEMTIITNVLSSGVLGSESPSMAINAVRPVFSRIGDPTYESDAEGTKFNPKVTGTIYCSPDPEMIDNVSSATFSSDNQNLNGFMQLSSILHGEFWKFKVVIPEYDTFSRAVDAYRWAGLIKSFLGLQLEANIGGDR